MTPQLKRREFLTLSAAATGGLMIGVLPSATGEATVTNLADENGGLLNQFIMIGIDNKVVLFNHRPEMGQGTFASMPMILAEELDVEISKVEVRQSDADDERYGSQNVVGSRSVQTEYSNLRKMGAAARHMLITAAAAKWGVPAGECTTEKGEVTHGSGMRLGYGELVAEAAKLKAPENPTLKDPSTFTIIGKSIRRQDIPSKTTGKAVYGMDVQVPGMKYATIEHCPVWLGKVVKYDSATALKIPGVTHVEKTTRTVWGRTVEGVAVIADNFWAALKAKKILRVEWDTVGLESISTETLKKKFMDESSRPGDVLHGQGDTEKVFTGGAEIIEARYELPYQAHVPMEPMNAIVNVSESGAEFWGSTQNPNGIRSFLMRKYNLKKDQVKINYTFMGGGFGRRSMTDVVEEAADLSSLLKVPIKLIWTREEDQTQGPFRNCSLNVCRAVLTRDGTVEALEHKIVAQEIQNQGGDEMKAGRQLMGGVTTAYAIPNVSIRGVLQKLHIPISYWRAVYHSTNPFAHESFIDELAIKAGKDSLSFRQAMLKDHARWSNVLGEFERVSGWRAGKKPGTGRGMAICERSGAHFAMQVEVRRENGRIVPVRVVTAIDVGTCINPDTVMAQVEGSVMMGLGAVYAGLTVNKGRIVEQNFDKYQMIRFNQTPEFVTHIVASSAAPDGAGEAGLPTIAPAFANAIYDLTGRRVRKLPMTTADLT